MYFLYCIAVLFRIRYIKHLLLCEGKDVYSIYYVYKHLILFSHFNVIIKCDLYTRLT